jgi:hypothetical protein
MRTILCAHAIKIGIIGIFKINIAIRFLLTISIAIRFLVTMRIAIPTRGSNPILNWKFAIYCSSNKLLPGPGLIVIGKGLQIKNSVDAPWRLLGSPHRPWKTPRQLGFSQ